MPHAVIPKTDCPHIRNITIPSSVDVKVPCSVCQDSSENWICLTCEKVFCSRYVKGDGVNHFNETKHCVFASFSDFSVWCYECDSYIKDPSLQGFLQLLSHSKFVQEEKEEKEDPEDSSDSEEEISGEVLKKLLGMGFNNNGNEQEEEECFLKDLTLDGLATVLKDGKFKNIIVMTGAGISVASGIPDFRTPGTGLYDNLQKYNLPHPTAVFELDYFRQNPQPFFTLAKELYPGNFHPTLAHYFIKLLHQKGILLRNFTQNIDTLERITGIPGDFLVEAHGSFATSHCINCKAPESIDKVKDAIFSDQIPKCKSCTGLIKPDIVFFGEGLPPRFFELMTLDFPKCDLLIVMGTSLQVHPFASLINKVSASTPRLLVNNEKVGGMDPRLAMFGIKTGFRFDSQSNYRDIAEIGDLQLGTLKLVKLCGWEGELKQLIQQQVGSDFDKIYGKYFQ